MAVMITKEYGQKMFMSRNDFSRFYDDDHLKRVVSEVFDTHSFKRIITGMTDTDLHFQSMILRKRSSSL